MRRPNVCGPFILNQQHLPYRTTPPYSSSIAHNISQSEFFFAELFEWLLSVNPFSFCRSNFVCNGNIFSMVRASLRVCAVFALSIFHTNSQQRQQCVVNKCFEYFLRDALKEMLDSRWCGNVLRPKIIFQFIP